MPQTTLIVLFSGLFIGGVLGYFLRLLIALQRRESVEFALKKSTISAKEKAAKIIEEAETKILKREEESRVSVAKKEDRIVKKEEILEKRQFYTDEKESELRDKEKGLKQLKDDVESHADKNKKDTERIAGFSEKAAKEELFRVVEKEHEADILLRLRKLESSGRATLEDKAKKILASAIHRYGNSVSNDLVTTAVTIPNEETKGRIIGKEGRNIRAFEKAAGVELVIDDTPGSVVISAFDPVRRQIAKRALVFLIADGRIQPAKIEEYVKKAESEVGKIIQEKGEEAAYEAKVLGADPRLLSILGRLHFRTSFGQNVLQHSIEMAHIAGVIASELQADVSVARAGALFHDIGKALDHEVEGTHVEIGRRVLEKFGIEKRVIQAMQSHHEEYPYETPESIIVQTADAISGGRPGARRNTAANYIKRLEDLETLAGSFDGVEKCYALSAGREIRVFVSPKNVSDLEARKIARELAVRIEEGMKYPGEIKVTVMRESHYIEYAR